MILFEEALVNAVGLLVSKGHSLKEIMCLSIRQLFTLVQLSGEREADWIQASMALTRVAFHADKAQYQQFSNELNDG